MSVQYITFLEFFNKFLPIVGFMPIIDFNEMQLIYVAQYKLYSICFGFLILFFWFNNCKLYFQVFFTNLKPLFTFNVVLLEVFCIFNYIIIIWGSGFWNQNSWLQLLKKSKSLETNWCLRSNLRWYRNGIFNKFILLNVIMLAAFLLNYPYFRKDINIFYGSTLFYIIMFYIYYVQFLESFITYNISMNIKHKYINLGKEFKFICNQQLKNNNRNFGTSVRKLARTFRDTNEIVDEFNQLFGWQQLLCLIIVGTVAVSFLNMLVFYISGYKVSGMDLQLPAVIGNLLLSILFCVRRYFA